jgi:nucleoside-diphosphate-sugar epimerase
VHLAAIVGEPACATNEAAAWSINVDGVQSALGAYRRSPARRFVFISTCSNYGIARERVATEDTALNPLSSYARAKVRAEEMVLAERRDVCVLRFGTICGLSARMRFDLLVNDMARAAATGRPIRVFGPKAWRPMLDVADAARAIDTCLTLPDGWRGSRLFNVVTENIQKVALVDLVHRHFPGAPVEIAEAETDPRDYRVSGERIRAELEYVPAGRVEESLLSVARAIAAGQFRDPFWSGYSAFPPDPGRLDADPDTMPADTVAADAARVRAAGASLSR